MRRYIPIIIVLAAFGVYEARDLLIAPLRLPALEMPWYAAVETAEEPMETQPRSAEPNAAEIQAPPAVNVVQGRVSRGNSFFIEMRKAGVSPVDIDRIVRASRKLFNLRKVRPGQEYAVYADARGRLDSLTFSINEEKRLKAHRGADGFETRIDTMAYEIEHYVTSGVIHNSIFATLQEKDADPELAGRLAVIFQWDIDFFTDIRKGDHFTILYERKVFEDGRSVLGRVLSASVTTRGREHYAFGFDSKKGSWSYYGIDGKSLQKSLLRAPLKFSRVTSNFSRRRYHPVTHTYRPHLGVDYGAPRGTPVHSTGDGTVVVAARHRANGNYVKIRHNSRYTTYYLHLHRFARGIKPGRRVKQGQVIGYVGSTGLATATHLDYRIKVGGRFVNPRTVRLPSKRPVPPSEMALFERVRDGCLLRLYEAGGSGQTTTLVEKPTPPSRHRMQDVL